MSERYKNRIELLQGTLDLLILQTLLWGPQHGYGVSQAIRANSGDRQSVQECCCHLRKIRLIKGQAIPVLGLA